MLSKGTCPNCKAEVDEGSKFCPECGTKIEAQEQAEPSCFETVFCSQCGTKTTTEFMVCPECGKQMGSTNIGVIPDVGVKSKFDLTQFIIKNKFVGIVAASVLILIILAGVLFTVVGNKSGKPYVLYAKDQELNFTNLSKIKPFEMTNKLIDSEEYLEPYEYTFLSAYILFSEDNKYIFYPDRIDGEGQWSYYWRNLKDDNTKSDAAHKIDSEIFSENIALSKDGSKFFYIKGEEKKLYIYDRKSDEKAKLDEEVSGFYINDEGDYLIYETYVDGEYTIYELSLKGLKGEESKLDSNSSIQYAYPNSKKVFYQKEGSLYLKERKKEKVKISSDVAKVISVIDRESVYYLKKEEITSKLSGFINDDMAASDKDIVEPQYPTYPTKPEYPSEADYSTQEWVSDYWSSTWNEELDEWGYWLQDTDWDRYNAAYTQYQEDYANWQTEYDSMKEEYDLAYTVYENKLFRDELRSQLESEENAVTYNKYLLYYWKDGKETAIASDIVFEDYSYPLTETSSEVPAVIYQKYSVSNVVLQKLSDLTTDNIYYSDIIPELQDKITSSRIVSDDTYLAYKEKESTIDSTDAKSWLINKDGIIYFLDDYDTDKQYGTLKSAKISGGSVETPVTIDEDVVGYRYGFGNNKIYYYKDVKDGSGDLYLKGKIIATDVYINSLYSFKDSDSLLYYVDYSDSNYDGTLCLLKGDKETKISDDVTSFAPISESNIAYLVDYSNDREKGDLMLYQGKKKSVAIDTDVTEIVWLGSNFKYRFY